MPPKQQSRSYPPRPDRKTQSKETHPKEKHHGDHHQIRASRTDIEEMAMRDAEINPCTLTMSAPEYVAHVMRLVNGKIDDFVMFFARRCFDVSFLPRNYVDAKNPQGTAEKFAML